MLLGGATNIAQQNLRRETNEANTEAYKDRSKQQYDAGIAKAMASGGKKVGGRWFQKPDGSVSYHTSDSPPPAGSSAVADPTIAENTQIKQTEKLAGWEIGIEGDELDDLTTAKLVDAYNKSSKDAQYVKRITPGKLFGTNEKYVKTPVIGQRLPDTIYDGITEESYEDLPEGATYTVEGQDGLFVK